MPDLLRGKSGTGGRDADTAVMRTEGGDGGEEGVRAARSCAGRHSVSKGRREGESGLVSNLRAGGLSGGVRKKREETLRYGVPYQGSKSRIAGKIVGQLPVAKHFYDLFAGGCAMTHCAMVKGAAHGISPARWEYFHAKWNLWQSG